jgi:hypothetical protein
MSARETIPGLLGAPFRSISDIQRPITFGQHRSRQYREISRGYAFDYGALPSIREQACGSDRHHYFLRRDEQMYVLLVQEAVLRGISSFLEVHNVDLGQFESQAKIIFNQTINNDNSMKVGNVAGSGNNFGHGSRAHGGTGDSDDHHRKGP